ncbi:MAG TPA: efflux RND transporter periplasmic adaptor subunit [Candidatus Limnocylindrales bacterium]|nr:efflux RND transporter periplasmic adaptor subunit [Candidatus Limnocylindrales bacterium]
MKTPRHLRSPIVALLPGAMLVAAFIFGCGSGPGESASQMTSYTSGETPAETAALFTVPQDQMSHVQVVAVQKTKLARVLRMTGTVTYNLFKTTPVFTAVGGPVHEILVAPGENVKAGQAMLTVNSPDYSMLRSAYIKARDTFQLAEKNYNRSKDLYDHHAIAERDMEQAESDRAQAQADLQSSEAGLRVLGVADPEALAKGPASFQVPLLAPVSGMVTDRLVGPGQLLAGGSTQCFTISDMSTVWVLLNVYQSDLGAVRVGDSVDITTDSYPEVFHGRVSYVAAAVDPTTRTLQARIVTDNPGEKLKNNMYVTATVRAGVIDGALLVPDAAVLRDTENQPFVYVQTESNKFARQLVTLGESQGGHTQITAGLKGDEHVVGDGSLFLQFKNSLQH